MSSEYGEWGRLPYSKVNFLSRSYSGCFFFFQCAGDMHKLQPIPICTDGCVQYLLKHILFIPPNAKVSNQLFRLLHTQKLIVVSPLFVASYDTFPFLPLQQFSRGKTQFYGFSWHAKQFVFAFESPLINTTEHVETVVL